MIPQDVFSQYDVENNKFECKSRLDKENVLGWLKTIDGFANGTGGIIFLGVEDKTNKLIGYDASDIDKEKQLKNIHLMILKCCKNFITKILDWC